MHVLIANNLPIPALKYGGTERDIWWLGKELVRRGHKVTYLVPAGSSCPFADIIFYDPSKSVSTQVPRSVDIVHSHFHLNEEMPKPFLVSMHGYIRQGATYHRNTNFMSKRHAELHHCSAFVYNGLDPADYGTFDAHSKRSHLLFLGIITRVEKNFNAAIRIASEARKKLAVIGGSRLTLRDAYNHIHFYGSPNVRFYGIIGGEKKNVVIGRSSALLFPVTWDEPLGLALIESMYHGCPVIGTPYGSLPEIVNSDVGFLSASMKDLIEAAKDHSQFSRKRCHDYVMSKFTSRQMTDNYLIMYERILSGEYINPAEPYFTPDSFTEKYPLLN